MKAVLELPDAHAGALQIILNRLPLNDIPWVLTGSASLRLQGVDVAVHDLDLQTDEKHIYLVEKSLEEYVKTPVQLGKHPKCIPWMAGLKLKASQLSSWQIFPVFCQTVPGPASPIFPGGRHYPGAVVWCPFFPSRTKQKHINPWGGSKSQL